MSDIDLRRYTSVLWKWLWLIILCCALAAGISYKVTRSLPKTYLTSTTLVIGDIATDPNVTAAQLNDYTRLADAYVDMARRQPILQATSDALRLGVPWWQLQNQVLTTRDGAQMVIIRVVDTNPQRAKAIADEIAHQLILQSPTTQNERALEQRRQFVQQQLDTLQANIQDAEKALAEKQAALDQASGARTVLDLQDQINALNAKITGWRSTYASLLNTQEVKPPNTLTVLEPAHLPTEPSGPNLQANVLAASLLGFLLASGAALLIEYLDDTLKTPEQATRSLSLPSLGSIARMGGRLKHTPDVLIALRKPNSPITEAYRMLRTNVQLAAGDTSPPVILVTSPGLHEGKSTTSANLAISFAQAGKRTILVDADLRHPSLHTLFHLDNCDGLSELLTGEARSRDSQPREPRSVSAEVKRRIEAYLVPTSIPTLRVLTTGQTPAANSAELLSSPRTELVLTILRGMADVIIFDSPPVLPVADTTLLAAKGMAVVLVVQVGRTRLQDARLAVQNLHHAQAQILGIVLNKAPTATPNYYAYRYPPEAANHDVSQPPQVPLDASGTSAG